MEQCGEPGACRREGGEDIQLSFLGAVPFLPCTVIEAVYTQVRAFALGWRTGPLEEQLYVEGGYRRQGVSYPYPIIPKGDLFFNVKMSQTRSQMLV